MLTWLTAALAAAAVLAAARPRVEVVVARYAEDLAWLDAEIPADWAVTVYDKGSGSDFARPARARVVRLPNVGRCDHTYLWHLWSRYDSLADVTVFVPGSAAMPGKLEKLRWVVRAVRSGARSAMPGYRSSRPLVVEHGAFQLDEWRASDGANATANPETALAKCPERPFGRWYARNFPGRASVTGLVYQGVFAVSRPHARNSPRSTYARLLRYVDSHSNPEAGHYMERAWAAAFDPMDGADWW